MLANIAHCFLVAGFGLGGFEPFLVRYIIENDRNDSLYEYIGHSYACNMLFDENKRTIEDNIVSMYIIPCPQKDGSINLLVNIFILPQLDVPLYGVVAGKCRADQIPAR
jgi:hypothetical protein